MIIITILHIIIITTSILNLGFKTIAPRTLAHTNAQRDTKIYIILAVRHFCLRGLGRAFALGYVSVASILCT